MRYPQATIGAKAATVKPNIDAHCGRPGCFCTHNGDCYRGWIDSWNLPDPITIPCRNCRPDLAKRLDSIPEPGRRNQADMARLQGKTR